jgi:hypothetical protein
MPTERWTWHRRKHPEVNALLAANPADPEVGTALWCDRLESAPADAIVGKVLCVCIASAVARAAIAQSGDDPETVRALDLLDQWIDDPTNERFEAVTALIFPARECPEIGPHAVSRWALRTATAAVGCAESGWALAATCQAALKSGLRTEELRETAVQAVLARRRP